MYGDSTSIGSEVELVAVGQYAGAGDLDYLPLQ
eukprot:CAMPEP_0178516308 /NCGR_PEP_ID=MMETSP0696-20121128/25036_1 /TAXON_ID=265572 /ORGANISM="Extubocellulus spinifer, Strain CCMP396" /LENGTH=32 /DNA_ID= /DNA_START= /DNA_END= /DNA_ORIENTATION=